MCSSERLDKLHNARRGGTCAVVFARGVRVKDTGFGV